MLGVLVLVAFALLIVGTHWIVYRATNGRSWSVQWMAFSATACAALFLVAGATGYNLSRHARFVSGTAWSDGVIWSEIVTGVVMLAVAALCWVIALRSYGASSVSRP